MPHLKISLTILIVLGCMYIQAQSTFSKISGKVVDAENNSPVVGVSVMSSASSKGVTTDVEGGFIITLEQNKKHTLLFTAVGYGLKEVNDLSVTGGENAALNISMTRNKKELEAVTVRVSARKESVASLYSTQKNSSAISDGISAEIIRKSPDKNTADVLKRVSGASIQDNKFVVIRGLSERYNVSLLNNSVLPSTEADKKAFAFDIIPSSVIDNLVIYKSATPDLPGDFSGGAIKVLTKDYPSRKISELSVSIGYNSLTTGKNFYKSYPNGSLDGVGFFDHSRLIPGPYYRHKNGFILNSSEFKNETTKLFPNTFGYQGAYKSLPTVSASYTGGNTAVLKNGNKLGYIYSLGYSNGRAVSERERSNYTYDTYKSTLLDYNTSNYDEKNSMSALLNLTYAFGKSKISLKNLFNNNFIKNTGIREGANYETDQQGPPILIKSANSEASANGLVNSVLEGVHKLGKDWTADWNTSVGYTYKNQPDQRILAFRTDQNSAAFYLKLSNENSPEIRNAGRVYSFLGEYIYGVSANASKQFQWLGQSQKFKFGTMNYYRDRKVEVDALGYASFLEDPLTHIQKGVTIPETKGTSYNTLFSPANIEQYKLTVANIETNSTDYSGNAMMNAGYLMLDNKFSDKLRLSWGARVEKYHQELASKGKAAKVYDNTDILPSLLLTYAVSNKANVRIAGSEAVNRPEFRELADYSVFDYDNYVVIRGNPDLVRCKNTNADLRYEWFPAAGEIISASIFYKYFDKPIEQTNKGNDVLSYENADHATAYGAEVEFRKKLDFIGSPFFQQVTFYANAAYIKGSVQFNGQNINSPLQGQSPYLVNGGFNYTSPNDGFSFNLLYNRIGPRLRFRAIGGAALNIFEKPRDVMDFQISKKIFHNKLEAKITISDILAQPITWYYKYDVNPSNTNYKSSTDKIMNSIKYGTNSALTLRYSFGK
ncbi:MAG: carboxypeptidase-like regulatory domain-containing protein [Flavitalea sp.]